MTEVLNKSSLTLSTSGKNFSRRQFEIFSYFSRKPALTFQANCLDNLHEMSKPNFLRKLRKSISKCRLQCLLGKNFSIHYEIFRMVPRKYAFTFQANY